MVVLWLKVLVFWDVHLLQTVRLSHFFLHVVDYKRAQLVVVRLVFVIIEGLPTLDLLYDSVDLFA